MTEKMAPCNDCVHACDPTPREIRWYLPQEIKEVLNQLEDAGYVLSFFIFCVKKQSIESLVGERECEEQERGMSSDFALPR